MISMKNTIYLALYITDINEITYFVSLINSNSVAHNSEDMLCIMDSQDFHKRRDGPFIISIYSDRLKKSSVPQCSTFYSKLLILKSTTDKPSEC